MNIFDLVTAKEIASYWEMNTEDRAPYVGEELFPSDKKLGLDLKYIKGSKGLPVVLNPSAFDVKAIPRKRIGFSKLMTQMPYFKESIFVDEELRQDLNKVMETGNQAYIDAVLKQVMDDTTQLLEGAGATRERMRQMALTTGMISISANGENLDFDYNMPEENHKNSAKPWSDPKASIIDEIASWQDEISDKTGVRPLRAECDRKTWSYFLKNEEIRNAILKNNTAVRVSDSAVKAYLLDELELSVVVNTKRYADEDGVATPYVPTDTFVLFPTGKLGNTWFGTTPEESDLQSSNVANVAIVDTGVAITTIEHADPVNVETKVSMVCLPSFETIDSVVIADVTQGA